MSSRPANADTSISSVERGRWKLVISRSTTRKLYPGVIMSLVCALPAPGAHSSQHMSQSRGDLVALRMHFMLLKVFDLHRLEGSGTDLEIEAFDEDPSRGEPFEELRRKMQPGGRRRDASLGCGIHGLIPYLVYCSSGPADVRWQRQLAISLYGLLRADPDKANNPIPVREHFQDLYGGTGAESDLFAWAECASGFSHGQPDVRPGGMDEQELCRCTGGTSPQQACVAYSGGVEDQEITGRNEAHQIRKLGVLQSFLGHS